MLRSVRRQGNRGPVMRFGAAVAVIGVLGSVGPLPLATADDAGPPAISSAQDLLAAIQGGRLLGVPPLPDVIAGSAADLASPEFWSNYVREVVTNNKVLLPIPIDVVKPDVVLPHAPVASGGYVSALPSAPIDLLGVTYEWAGGTKTVADFLHDTGTDVIEFAHNGTLVAQYFANGWSDGTAHQAWSTTKSFVSTLVGIALDQHLIASLDDPIETYVPDLAGTAWQGVTIRNVLEMRSGVHWDEHTEELTQNTQVEEWIELALDYYTDGRSGKTRNEFLRSLPRSEPPGERFNYNSANTQVLAWMLESIYHQPFDQVLSQQLWQPAGMEASADIMTDRVGAAVASEELFARPRDFVRLGELMRNGGRTPDGRGIVSEQWITAATTGMKPASDAGDDTVGGYGFQWWSGATPDGFQANGFQGQYITVAPSACVTGVRLAHTLQFSTELKFAGQGNDEWHALYRAVLARLGGC
ncbi:serine hydrolase domain-containing protein [Nocardia tengchongensis]|uniref:serine hydrolase domain-containing protein n=1 Tax=Nocardia tengchongensis TaxID=2055889 RepID=UPI0036ACD149